MKLTKLSLIATLAISSTSTFAGGDITPLEPTTSTPTIVNEVCNSNTTINGKLTGYYYSDDSVDLFDNDSSEFALAATLDVTHKFNNNIAMNFSAIGYVNTIKRNFIMEGDKHSAFINVANITANYYDTTFILGRQLLDTPMLGGFDWLLAPGAFEAYTIANNSIDNLTIIGSYVRTHRTNNTGDNFNKLDGDNWTLGAVYDDKTISANLWYYNVDALKYSQVYVDAGYNFGSFALAVQYVNTDFDTAKDSDLFAIKATASLGGFDFVAAYSNLSGNVAGYVGRDTIYTSSWNTFASTVQGDSFKFEASTKYAGIIATASYAYYEYKSNDEGHEFDLILGYDITKCIDVNIVYSNTNYGSDDDVNAIEIYANYKF
jgi:hypothetical protein